MIVIIAAVAENNALGKDNKLLWHLSDDLKRFKALTLDGYILMGRKTFESLPGVLPRRKHIVITRNPIFSVEGGEAAKSIQEAIKHVPSDKDVFVIGGGEIYAQSLEIADKIELTRVHQTFDGDTFFPELDKSQWELTYSEFHPKDEKHQFDFTFETYLRIKT
jgi:dihydrofolate reductase